MTSLPPVRGRGAAVNPKNRFESIERVPEPPQDSDDTSSPQTQFFADSSKSIVAYNDSPDVGFDASVNPYRGCEHGCVYCYARPSHEYLGFSAGLDFETKIMVKEDAPELLRQELSSRAWKPQLVALSGNTDCYQPQEKKLEITRKMLKVMVQYRHPVSIISKNSLVLRDLDLLQDLASSNLVHVYISITTLNEDLRRVMEPRTASAIKRLQTVEGLAKAGVPVGIMNAPIIPALNHHEIPQVLKAAADHGAQGAGMTIVRLNGSVGQLFEDWLHKNFPDRFDKVLNQIRSLHGGTLNDSQFGRRMTGEGNIADSIHQLFRSAKKKYFKDKVMPPYDLTKFRKGGNLSLF